MIPVLLLLQPTLPWLLAARFTATYWQTLADSLAAFNEMNAQADILPFPPPQERPHIRSTGYSADIVRFPPGNR